MMLLLPGCLGDTQFSFRIRHCGGHRSPWHTNDKHYDSGVPMSLQVRMNFLEGLPLSLSP